MSKQMKEYVVLANLGTEAIFLEANSETEAISKARTIVAEVYSSSTLADSANYQVEVK